MRSSPMRFPRRFGGLHARGLLALALLWGCASTSPGEEPALELGTGSWRFEPLEDGQEVELVRGAQGGWHVWLSVRVRGMSADAPRMRLTMQPADESRAPQSTEVVLPFDPPGEDGWRKLIGYTGVVHDPSCLVGQLLRIELSIPLEDGRMLREERDVLVRGGTYPPPPCE